MAGEVPASYMAGKTPTLRRSGRQECLPHGAVEVDMPGYQDSLNTIQTIVGDPAAFRGGKPQWKTVEEMDRFLTGKGFRLTDAQAMGPKGKPDGQQLIYDGPNNVIVKVKTRGYSDGG